MRGTAVRIVITGGAGFIGSLVAERLLERGTFRGEELTSLVLTDRFTPRPALAGDPRVEVITGDLPRSCPSCSASPWTSESISLPRCPQRSGPIPSWGCARSAAGELTRADRDRAGPARSTGISRRTHSAGARGDASGPGEAIVGSWPSRFANQRAAALGLHADIDALEVVRAVALEQTSAG